MVDEGPTTARYVAPPTDLELEVRGVGPIELPVKAATVKQLRAVARRAPYGKGEDTIVDPKVRDTWEIPKSRVKIDKRRWNATLEPVLESVGDDLGLAESFRLRAELHSMLVYEQGQFFAPHQDSEKSDDMVGSLVVMLPSTATGGELVVGQGDGAVSYRGLKSSLVFVAFYGDTIHEVRPVRSGHRVVLTYNLLLVGEEDEGIAVDGGVVDGLVALLDDHFTEPADLPSWQRRGGVTAEPPDRLVYLLDHGYTSRGLSWRGLKGADGDRARLLRAAADRLDLDVVLTQAKVSETWSAMEDWEYGNWRGARGGRYGSGWDTDHDDDHDDGTGGSDADYQLQELLESSVELLAVKGVRLERGVDDSELCESTPSGDLTPDGSRYEGYMGNYGNTLDRWYQRAAVVLWPRSQSFMVRAKGDPVGALAEIVDDAVRGRESAADKISALAPRWGELYSAHRQGWAWGDDEPAAGADATPAPALALAVAELAEDDDDAGRLLAPVPVTALTVAEAGTLVAVVDRFGLAWARDWLYEWTSVDAPAGFGLASRRRYRPGVGSPVAWVGELPAFCRAVMKREEPSAGAVGATLATAAATWVLGAVGQAVDQPAPSGRRLDLTMLGPAVRAVVAAADIVDAPNVGAAVVEALGGPDADPEVLPCLVAAVLEGGGQEPGVVPGQSDLAAIATFCVGQLETRLAQLPRAEGDWGIALPSPWPDPADSPDAATLGEFLTDAGRQKFVWPLAQARRQEMHQLLDRYELPVRHVTERTGSPHKLVLTKTEALFETEAAARAQDEADLGHVRDWLAAV